MVEANGLLGFFSPPPFPAALMHSHTKRANLVTLDNDKHWYQERRFGVSPLALSAVEERPMAPCKCKALTHDCLLSEKAESKRTIVLANLNILVFTLTCPLVATDTKPNKDEQSQRQEGLSCCAVTVISQVVPA